jgi:hypothetical protein
MIHSHLLPGVIHCQSLRAPRIRHIGPLPPAYGYAVGISGINHRHLIRLGVQLLLINRDKTANTGTKLT